MNKLHIGDNFSLPLEAVTETFLVLGQRGGGKTNTAAVIAEELYANGAPFCVLTPIDVWWGLKSSADGKGSGLPIYIFGGQHADLPLAPTAGKLMADVLVAQRISCVICTQGFSGKERAAFVTDFAERLLQKNRQPLHLIVEEADAFIPQKPYAGEERMLGAMDRLIRWGRSPSALGGTFISQRSAKINKDITTQCSVLIAHRTSGPQDIDAIKEWFKYHSDPDRQKQVLAEISSLPKGSSFIYSPAWLEYFGKVAVRRRKTFDSAATPKLGDRKIEPKTAPVNLELLEKQMAETIEKAKQDDPRELRKENQRLKAELAAKPVTVKPVVDTTAINALLTQVKEAQRLLKERERIYKGFHEKVTKAVQQIAAYTLDIPAIPDMPALPIAESVKLPPPPPAHRPAAVVRENRTTESSSSPGSFSPLERRILTVLAERPEGCQLDRLAILAGYSPNGHFSNVLGGLRSRDLVSPARVSPITVTDKGIAELGPVDPLPTGDDLQRYWLGKLGKLEAKIMEVLFERRGVPASLDELAQAAGYSPNGHFSNVLGGLRTRGLISPARMPITAAKEFFED